MAVERVLDLEVLAMILEVAETKNFSHAARKLNCSQPHVSTRIKKLEKEIGKKLFIRSRPVEITEEGRELREHAESVFAALDAAEGAMREKRGVQRGTLKVGHTASQRDAALEAAAHVMEDMPGVKIVLEEMLGRTLEERLLAHRLDLGLTAYASDEPEKNRGLRDEPLGSRPFSLVVNRKHELADTKKVLPLSTLRNARFALVHAERHREALKDYFASQKFPANVVVEASTVRDVLALVRKRRELVTILALPTPHLTDLTELVRLEVAEAPLERSFALWPAPHPGSKAAEAFLAALRECFLTRKP